MITQITRMRAGIRIAAYDTDVGNDNTEDKHDGNDNGNGHDNDTDEK